MTSTGARGRSGLSSTPSLRASLRTSEALVMQSSPMHVSPRPTGPVSSSALTACNSASRPLRPESLW